MCQKTRQELLQKIKELEHECNQLRQESKKTNSNDTYLREILDNVPAPIYLKDAQGNYRRVNKKYEELAGVKLADIVGKNDFDIFPQPVAELFRSQDEEVIQQGTPLEFEETIPLTDGIHTYITSKFPLHGKDGTISAVGGFCTDITVRKQADDLLLESKLRLQYLIESTSDWVWEVDEDGRYTYVSPRIRDLLGYEPEEVLNKTPFDFMPPEEAERIRKKFTTAVAEYKPIKALENINLHKDGHQVILETSGVPFFDASGKFRGYRGIDRDMTERKLIEIEKEKLIVELQEALDEVNLLSGLLPICASCKNIRDDKGFWNQVEHYLASHSDLKFTHSICPKCAKKLYPDLYDDKLDK